MSTITILETNGSIAKVKIGDKITDRKIYNTTSNPFVSYKGARVYVSELAETTEIIETPKFNINERFDMLENFTNMVLNGLVNSVLITGQGGLGKSHTVLSQLDKMKLTQDEDYVIIKGFSTPKALYATLYENSNKIVIFDDCDSVLKDPIALNILKGALDTYEKRTISWNTRGFISDELPSSFNFNGQIIFISNLESHKVDQAVKSRAISVDVSMNNTEKIERIESIAEHILPEYSMEIKKTILTFVGENITLADSFNIRTFQNLLKIHAQYDGKGWETPATYVMTNS